MNNFEFWENYLTKLKIAIKEKLQKKDELYIDLHIHSNYSADGKQTVKEILESTKEKGFDIIAITDHDSVDAYNEIAELVSDKLTDPLIIPGIEFTTDNKEYGNQCHILQLFINPKDKDLIKNVTTNYKAAFNRSKIQFERLKSNQAMNEIIKHKKIKISYDEYIKYINYNLYVPEYDTLCFYLMDKLKEKNVTTFDLLDLLEKYNEEDVFKDRKEYKTKRYKKLREKYQKIPNNYNNSRFLLSMLAVREVDDDWWDGPSSGSLSVNSYGQLRINEINNKFPTFWAHPTEESLKVVEKELNNNKFIIGLEHNIRNEYKDINNFNNLLEKHNLLKIMGSDSHDNSLQFYNDLSFYKISKDDLQKVMNKIG